MLNQIVLVGRLAKEIELEGEENKVAHITLAVPRSFKNSQGQYDTDFIPCILYESIASNAAEYCNKGDIVGIKGKMQKLGENEPLTIIAEKVTFVSSSHKEKDDKEIDEEE